MGGYGYPGYGYTLGYAYPGSVGSTTGFAYSSAYGASGTGTTNRRYLGIDEEAVIDSDGRKVIKVGNVYPGTPAERAGLHTGDVIRSINGYFTEQRGNLAWIIANAAPSNTLKMVVRTVDDNKDHEITATLQ
jgi:S1-C subfamily serine protease